MAVMDPAMLPAGVPRPATFPVAPAALLRRPRSALTWVTVIVLGWVACDCDLDLSVAGPVGALIATLLAAVSFPVMILICFWLIAMSQTRAVSARRTRLGRRRRCGASFVGEQLVFGLSGTNEFINLAVAAPLVEELGKGLFLVAVVIFRRPSCMARSMALCTAPGRNRIRLR